VSWNALCISAYLLAARVLRHEDARRFALRSLDRILAEAWNPDTGLRHAVAYSDGASKPENVGFLDDYAFTALATLDAYENTSDLTYFSVARKIVDRMIERFFDSNGGFVDCDSGAHALGVLTKARKPFQDSPTPAGNPAAAIALIRMHAYTGDASYRNKAEATLQLAAGIAGQYGLFAATFGIAVVQFVTPHTQVVVLGEDHLAAKLCDAAVSQSRFGTSVLKLSFNEAVKANLPPAIGATIPYLPILQQKRSAAVLCSEGSCKPPVYDPEALTDLLAGKQSAA
jgi:uncharacterized protein YyaL (SSP411 family)